MKIDNLQFDKIMDFDFNDNLSILIKKYDIEEIEIEELDNVFAADKKPEINDLYNRINEGD